MIVGFSVFYTMFAACLSEPSDLRSYTHASSRVGLKG